MTQDERITLKDIYDIVNRLDDKTNERLNKLEDKTDKLEAKVDNLLGKIGIGVMVISAFISSGVAYVFSLFKKQ